MQLKLHMVTIEDLVPQGHFLRKLEDSLNLSFVREETRNLYSAKYGRPPIDPVMLVKYVLVGYLYGIPSERQIEQRIQTDVALRWYLGLDLFDSVPDHSTISQLRRRKPSFRKVFRRLFLAVVSQCVESGLVSGRVVSTDSTHVKANASRASERSVETEAAAGLYWERLDVCEEAALEELKRKRGKRRGKRTQQVKRDRCSHKKVSCTDPEAGHLKRPGKPSGPHYLNHLSVDTDHGIILDSVVTPGDSSDLAPYLEQLERIHETVIPIQTATADAAYDMPLVHHALWEKKIIFHVHPRKQGERPGPLFAKERFLYHSEEDVYLCPGGTELRPNGISRTDSNVYWAYMAERRQCQCCPLRERCLKTGTKKVLYRSVFEADVRRNLDLWDTPAYREALHKRRIWSEGTFAAQKWGHNLTRVLRRGLEAAEDHCLLSATALNLKRMIRCLG